MSTKQKNKKIDYIQIQIASPETILKWSHGEVKKAETINYRTYRPEPDGLMCEKIFGPTKDYECYCGKYKKYRYKGIICDKCGVEVTKRSVRRERLGHIRLNSPVVHIWYLHGSPYKLPLILGIPQKKVEAVTYFSRYLVIEHDEDAKLIAKNQLKDQLNTELSNLKSEIENKIKEIEKSFNKEIKLLIKKGNDFDAEIQEHEKNQKIAKLKEDALKKQKEIENYYHDLNQLVDKVVTGETLTEEEYTLLQNQNLNFFEVGMGAEAIQYLLKKLDLVKLKEELQKDIKSVNPQKRLKAFSRLRLINSLVNNNIKPEWMVLEVLPVMPPDLRPIVQISGGRFATSDLNDLYRRVINRNNRLKRLIELGAPEVILRNEKRMLQEAVDALIDNEHRFGNPIVNKRKIPLKSLSAILRGKQGRFRQNLLGKRVDYSGRSVIVCAGRDIKINEVGIPKHMALELFKPFVLHQLIDRGLASNAKSAKFMIEEREKNEEIWNILEEVIKGHPVLLNRAPTLHKQGIQAFYPVLVDGDAIRIHALVTEGFNADFDGDQMAVHVPLTKKAIEEAIEYMMPKSNLLKAASGEFIMNPGKDLLQGMFYLTKNVTNPERKHIPTFTSFLEAEQAYHAGTILLKEPIKVYNNDEWIETSVGRIIFNNQLPSKIQFINQTINKKVIKNILLEIYNRCTIDEVLDTLDKINDIGFKYSTTSGFSLGMSDLIYIKEIDEIVEKALAKNREIDNAYKLGFLTQRDKSELFRQLWINEVVKEVQNKLKDLILEENALKETAESGSRYSYDVINQIIGVKGPVTDASQRLVELPITSNYLKGFEPFEYFIAAKGARKGLVDKGLRTADSGYLTRKLCEVAHDSIIREEDCNTDFGIIISKKENNERMTPFKDRIIGRALAKELKIQTNTEIITIKRNEIITSELADLINNSEIEEIEVRSPLTCKTHFGVCQMCYGIDLGTNKLVEIGKAVGILAAQSAGEPTTQLTMRTFHVSGAAAGPDITMGFPRVLELFEARIPKGKAYVAEISGKVKISSLDKYYNLVTIQNVIKDVVEYPYTDEDKLSVNAKNKKVKAGQVLFVKPDGKEVIASRDGKITILPDKILFETEIVEEVEYKIPKDQELLISNGEFIELGTPITKGNLDPKQMLQTKGILEAQKYLIKEIQKVYEEQGINVNDKHLEVIIAQMGRFVKVIDPGDTLLLPGDVRDKSVIDSLNKILKEKKYKVVKFQPLLLGVTGAALKTESFLSAASFQEQVRIISDAAIMGARDYLRGLKENVIIGRLIPTGENARLDPKIEQLEPLRLIKE